MEDYLPSLNLLFPFCVRFSDWKAQRVKWIQVRPYAHTHVLALVQGSKTPDLKLKVDEQQARLQMVIPHKLLRSTKSSCSGRHLISIFNSMKLKCQQSRWTLRWGWTGLPDKLHYQYAGLVCCFNIFKFFSWFCRKSVSWPQPLGKMKEPKEAGQAA